MPRYICKIDNLYFEWSLVVDNIVTEPIPLDEFKKYYIEEYGRASARELEQRLERVEKKGTSAEFFDSVEELIPKRIINKIKRTHGKEKDGSKG